MMQDHKTTLSVFAQSVISTLRSYFADTNIQQFGIKQPFDDNNAPVTVRPPCLLLEIAGFGVTDANQCSPRVVALQVNCAIHALLPVTTPDLQLELLDLGGTITGLLCLHDSAPLLPPNVGQRWGLERKVESVDRSSIVCVPGEYGAGLHGFDSVKIGWTQTVYIPELLEII
ncbi:hypothetical protein [Thiospirillum jenense]|uniref:Uncharacterized protein n=1 Tax=Thiospirillum jenense TaxID=1653858 RepID=A0A839HEF9_9GAMM|nr:hypothetical protein [Thiospirillum jenense]MBB1125557.1 hypothetical protein [Thiospirillum jenense]